MGNKAHIERMLDITPERLVACGFYGNVKSNWEKKYDDFHILHIQFSNGLYYPTLEEKPTLSSICVVQFITLRPITKMHELQALWKVLTGEKLTSDAT